MVEREINRMEAAGPTRGNLKRLLDGDRKIVANLYVSSAVTVLRREHDFTEEQIESFHRNLRSEVAKY